jgi:hypothetical protein
VSSRFGVDAQRLPRRLLRDDVFHLSRREDKLDIGHIMFFDLFHNPEPDARGEAAGAHQYRVDHARALLTRMKAKALMAQADAKEIDDEGEVKPKRRFDARDWDYIAEYVIDMFEKRRKAAATAKSAGDIDRQVAMRAGHRIQICN